jgi:hypothetical protein
LASAGATAGTRRSTRSRLTNVAQPRMPIVNAWDRRERDALVGGGNGTGLSTLYRATVV